MGRLRNKLFGPKQPETIREGDFELSPDGNTLVKYHKPNNAEFDGVVRIPEGVEHIDRRAFQYEKANGSHVQMSGIKEIIAPSVTEIPDMTFMNNNDLQRVELPSATKIGEHAFHNCSQLENVEIPNAIKIDPGAFYQCPSLQKIDLPAVQEIEQHAFSRTGITSASIGSDVFAIGKSAFESCRNLETVTMPNEVSSSLRIEESAFQHDKKLSQITIPDGTIAVGNNAFLYCESLNVAGKLPNSIQEIGDHAFNRNGTTGPVVVPANASSVGEYAFQDDFRSKITQVIVPEETVRDNPQLSRDLQRCCVTEDGNRKPTILPEEKTVTQLAELGLATLSDDGKQVMSVDSRVTGKVTVDVESIYQGAFSQCKDLTAVEITNNVKDIGNGAFLNCEKLKDVEIHNGVTKIGDNAFANTNIERIELPPSVETLGAGALKCNNLREISIYMNTELGDQSIMSNKMEKISVTNENGNVVRELDTRAVWDNSVSGSEKASAAEASKGNDTKTLDDVYHSYNQDKAADKDGKSVDAAKDKASEKDDVVFE